MLYIEKTFYDKYEEELENLNENLEDIVESRTNMLVQAKEESLQASLLKAQFIANTSHELRTPVQGLIGFVTLAKKRLEKMSGLNISDLQLREKSLASLESADQSSQRLMGLIDTLLKITRSESDGFTPRPARFGLSEVVAAVVGQVKSKANSKSMSIDLNNMTSEDEAHTDKIMVGQVLENLLTNAIRYGNQGTSIKVDVEEMRDQFKITVTNQGVGVAPVDVDIIFEPFVQGSRTDASTGGTGLGLSLCKKFSAAINGTVTLEDPAADHTQFSFSFAKNLS